MPNGNRPAHSKDVDATFNALIDEDRLYDLLDEGEFLDEMNSAQRSLQEISRGLLDTPVGDKCRALLTELSLLAAKMNERA